jgi:hypothetical protein
MVRFWGRLRLPFFHRFFELAARGEFSQLYQAGKTRDSGE